MHPSCYRHWRENACCPCSNIPELLPKHKIFLSHSGAQKPFVEQLCVDLEKAGHCPFFDQRPESLPKGEKFPELILDAARQCHVAVVVLSEDHLTSKWPMLELVTFVEAQRSFNTNLTILPLFYKLTVTDLEEQRANEQLMVMWGGVCYQRRKNWPQEMEWCSSSPFLY